MSFIEEKIRRVDGSQTTKKYQLLKEIGAGSFSKCWKVRTLGTDKVYAMKIIPKKNLLSLQQEKLVNEIQIHQALSHPNIVFLQHSFEDVANQYIFLEYCANGTLEELCHKYQSAKEEDIRRYGRQILQAIQYLHSKKILHRDLKLSNCFLDSENNIKIGDFGFACRLQSNQQLKRQTCGTPNFLPPEVASGFGHSYPSDIWSFGVILYRMKYGICPFQTPTLQQTIQRIKILNYEFGNWATISNDLKDLISKILVIDYDARLTIPEIEKHPFFRLQKGDDSTMKKSSSLTGFIKRLFSGDKNKPLESSRLKKVDSCKNLIDMKEILKQKTKENVVNIQQISTIATEVKQSPTTHQEISRAYFNKITSAKTSRIPIKSKKSSSVTQYHPHCLVYLIEQYNEYTLIYLTNGIRQIMKDGQNYLVLNASHCCDRTGRKLAVVPRLIIYIIQERMKESNCKINQQIFEENVQRKNYIIKWRSSSCNRIFILGNSTIMATDINDIFYLYSDYCEFLYNSRLQIVNNDDLLKKCHQSVFEHKQKMISPIILLKQRKFLE